MPPMSVACLNVLLCFDHCKLKRCHDASTSDMCLDASGDMQPTDCCYVEASTSASSTTAHVGAPDYQTEEGCLLLDLSCLTQHADLPQEVADTVKNININRGSWADGALQQTTTLDRSQLLALQVISCGSLSGILCMLTMNIG